METRTYAEIREIIGFLDGLSIFIDDEGLADGICYAVERLSDAIAKDLPYSMRHS
jgi:hypothetical protein